MSLWEVLIGKKKEMRKLRKSLSIWDDSGQRNCSDCFDLDNSFV